MHIWPVYLCGLDDQRTDGDVLTSHLKDKGNNCFKCTLQPSRYSLDKFDERLLARDERITGSRFRQKVITDFN